MLVPDLLLCDVRCGAYQLRAFLSLTCKLEMLNYLVSKSQVSYCSKSLEFPELKSVESGSDESFLTFSFNKVGPEHIEVGTHGKSYCSTCVFG